MRILPSRLGGWLKFTPTRRGPKLTFPSTDEMNASYEMRDGYLYVKQTGEFEPTEARRIFRKWVAVARSAALTRVICDITGVSGLGDQLELTMTVYDIAVFVARSLPKEFRLAVVLAPEQWSEDRFGENVMRNRGACVKAALTLPEALEWLDLAPRQIPVPASCCA